VKKYFLFSDVHAMYDKLMTALLDAGFEIDNPNHIVVSLGDMLDRGDQGHEVILFLESMIKRERILGVIGNHDMFLLDLMHGDYQNTFFNIQYNGFDKTVDLVNKPEYYGIYNSANTFKEVAYEFDKRYYSYVRWLESLPHYLEFDNHVLVHGAINFYLNDWRNTTKHFAVWSYQSRVVIPLYFEKTIIVGHEPTRRLFGNGNIDDIIQNKQLIMIDGGAPYGGKVNVLVFKENEL
jgi:serine/threonine protein phosphatase 1